MALLSLSPCAYQARSSGHKDGEREVLRNPLAVIRAAGRRSHRLRSAIVYHLSFFPLINFPSPCPSLLFLLPLSLLAQQIDDEQMVSVLVFVVVVF